MYRVTWALVALPLLIAAFTVGPTRSRSRSRTCRRPSTPRAPHGSPATSPSGSRAACPGTAQAEEATAWVRDRLAEYHLDGRGAAVRGRAPGPRARAELVNLVARPLDVGPQRSPADDRRHGGPRQPRHGAGLDRNASGTAALIELARELSTLTVAHTIVFVSTDGGAWGNLGAAHLAEDAAFRDATSLAVVNLDTVAGPGTPRLELAGEDGRSPRQRTRRDGGCQLLRRERAAAPRTRTPSSSSSISASRSTSTTRRRSWERASPPHADRPAQAGPCQPGRTARAFAPERLGQIGRAAQALVLSVDGAAEVAQRHRVLRLPRRPRAARVRDPALPARRPPARARDDDRPLGPAPPARARARSRPAQLPEPARRLALGWRASRGSSRSSDCSRTGTAPAPARPRRRAATGRSPPSRGWSPSPASAGWSRAPASFPALKVERSDELAGHLAAMLVLCGVAVAVAVMNTYALLFVLPSLHAWLWAPHVRDSAPSAAGVVFCAGLAGPGGAARRDRRFASGSGSTLPGTSRRSSRPATRHRRSSCCCLPGALPQVRSERSSSAATLPIRPRVTARSGAWSGRPSGRRCCSPAGSAPAGVSADAAARRAGAPGRARAAAPPLAGLLSRSGGTGRLAGGDLAARRAGCARAHRPEPRRRSCASPGPATGRRRIASPSPALAARAHELVAARVAPHRATPRTPALEHRQRIG